ncbi:hypothetical protein D3C74_434920 [compost metagenome]
MYIYILQKYGILRHSLILCLLVYNRRLWQLLRLTGNIFPYFSDGRHLFKKQMHRNIYAKLIFDCMFDVDQQNRIHAKLHEVSIYADVFWGVP